MTVDPPRVPLTLLPTPLHRLDRVSERLGIDLWIKRDDLTGFALGGNKGRKIEYLMGQALAKKAEVVVSCGSAQSNFLRHLAAACSYCGIRAAATAMHIPYEHSHPGEAGLAESGGNLLLDNLLDLDLRVVPDGTWESLFASAENLALEYEQRGMQVMRVPVGGSSWQGAHAFVQAGLELGVGFDFVIVASSSGSTQVGLATAFADTATRVIGIACDPEPELPNDFAQLSAELSRHTGVPALPANAFEFDLRYVGPGYGVPSDAAMEAIRVLARHEGIFLDPIYSAKAFAGLVSMAEGGEIGGRVCFWHTGGVPALFALP